MPAVSTIPQRLRPYIFHGVALRSTGKQAVGECPFCRREDKFSVNAETGLWRCFVCNEGSETDKVHKGGNATTFLRMLWKRSSEAMPVSADLPSLCRDRKLVFPETLSQWGVVRSYLTGDWLVPGYGAGGELTQLYHYTKVPRSDRMALLATPDIPHGLMGMGVFDPNREEIHVCEGPWDGMAWWEVLRAAKRSKDGLIRTGSPSASLAASINVIAVPSCTVFHESWGKLFGGKKVVLLYDNDYPRRNRVTGVDIPPAGTEGMRRVATMLAKADTDQRPEEIHYLQWGEKGFDRERPDGFDVRDWLVQSGPTLTDRFRSIDAILGSTRPIPAEWIPGRSLRARKKGGVDLECVECRSWRVLESSWSKALNLTTGLRRALAVMLAAVTSTESVGDQLWVKIVGPASCGKSTLAEALSVNKKYILAKSTIRGFHSGFMSDRSGDIDNSLVSQVKNKTLIIKDGDTLLQSPNLQQILAEARDVYDRVSRAYYRTGLNRDYEGLNMTFVLCGTSSLRQLDDSELGERFLDCVVVEDIDEEEERRTALQVAFRAAREMSYISDGKAESRDGPELVAAKQLTGGYINYLRENAQSLLDRVEITDWAMNMCADLAMFVAYLRARPSKRQEEKAEREMSYRLTSQLVRMAKCLAVVLNEPVLNDRVMDQVRLIALDTARGQTFNIIKHLQPTADNGASVGALSVWTGEEESKLKKMLRFLSKIGALTYIRDKGKGGLVQRTRWRLSDRMNTLWTRIVDERWKHETSQAWRHDSVNHR